MVYGYLDFLKTRYYRMKKNVPFYSMFAKLQMPVSRKTLALCDLSLNHQRMY